VPIELNNAYIYFTSVLQSLLAGSLANWLTPGTSEYASVYYIIENGTGILQAQGELINQLFYQQYVALIDSYFLTIIIICTL